MKIGLFGGSFNPVHIAHYFIAEETLNQFDLDEVLLIPAYKQPFKLKDKILESDKRLELLKASNSNEAIKISDYEIKKGSISYTYETINYYKSKGELFLIIGADSAYYFTEWKKYKQIIDNVNRILVFPRVEYPRNKVLEKWDYGRNKIEFMDSILMEISSTEIRKRIRKGSPFRYLVPEEVYNIIKQKGYYK